MPQVSQGSFGSDRSDSEGGMSPNEVGPIITAYTGILCGGFAEFHEYAEKILDRPIYTHEFALSHTWEELKEASRSDFDRLSEWTEGKEIKKPHAQT
jgi:hypothetical protein